MNSVLAATLSFAMAFSGSGISALAASADVGRVPTGAGAYTESGNAKIPGENQENPEDTQEKKALSELTIEKIEDQTYTGSAIEPEVTLSDGDYTLVKDTDYTLTYSDNTDLGTASVTVIAIESEDTVYSGSITVNFQIISAVENGVGTYQGKLAYFTDGKVDTSKNGLVQDPVSKTWYYFANGYVDETYTNLVYYNGTWYFVHNGQINWKENTLAQVDGKGTWYYVEGGKINWQYTGLAYYNGSWFYIKKGSLDWTYTGLVNHCGGWYYVEKGKINWNYTNLVYYNGGWFYVEKGQINWNYSGLYQYNKTWFYIEKGKITWKYTGLTKYYSTWYYVEKSKLNWNYNSLVYYNGSWFSVQNGVVTLKQTGLVTYNGSQYYVENSKVNWNYTGLCNKDGNNWYYVEKGKVNTSYTGLVNHYGGWYYVEKGKINWNYTGIVKYNGSYFGVHNGKIDWTFTALVKSGDKAYYVKNGKVDWTYNGTATLYGTNTKYTVKNGVSSLITYVREMDRKAQDYSSATQYLILVDRSSHRVGIYQGSKDNWKNIAYWSCVVGASSSPTISGEQTVGIKGLYFNTGTRGRCWYYTQINGNYLFHSQIYDRSSSPVKIIDGTMDAAASHGCVRLSLNHAKWIYDNIPKGTKVYIY
jgi:lipoprotein-anchoring transpeptidase ErfK/SrfK/glucan-binding YG repeat protein